MPVDLPRADKRWFYKQPSPYDPGFNRWFKTSGWANQFGKRFRPDKSDLLKQSKNVRELTVGGYLTPIPVCYGHVAVGGSIVFMGVSGSTGRKLHLIVVINDGEIGGLSDILYNGASVVSDQSGSTWYVGPTGGQRTEVHLYMGTSGQTYPSALHAIWPDYTDNLANIAYVHIIHDRYNEVISGVPEFAYVIDGSKIYDPRTTLTAYSNNPALALADALSNTTRGMSKTIDWNSVETCADVCDDTTQTNGKPRRTIGLALRQVSSARQWIETLRAHAGVFLHEDGGTVFMVPDRPRSVDHYFTNDNILRGSLSLSYRKSSELPTIVEVTFTDPGEDDTLWRDDIHQEIMPGSFPDRVHRYNMPGITDPSEAKREAIERINRSLYVNRDITLVTHDYGLTVLPGDRMKVTHLIGLSGDDYRVTQVEALNPGSYRITGEPYDDRVYSNHVRSRSDWSDTDMDNPNAPPVPTGLVLTEIPFTLGDGRWATRIQANWDDMTQGYSHVREYRIRITVGSSLFYEGPSLVNEMVSGTIQDQVTYTVEVMSVSTTGKISAAASAAITAECPVPVPSDVSNFSQCIEAGGWLLLQWPPASGYVIEGYCLKRGAITDTWATAPYMIAGSENPELARQAAHKSCVLQRKDIPEGVWRIFVKAVDSRGQFSANAAHADVTVTADTAFRFAGDHSWTADDFTLTKMVAYEVEGLGWCVIPDDGESIEEGYVTGDPTWNTDSMGAAPLCLPRTSYGSGVYMIGDTWDLGSVLGGQWSMGGVAVEAVENGDTAGVSYVIQLSSNGTDWTDYEGQSVRGFGRYARIKIVDASDGPDAAPIVRLLPVILNLYVEQRVENGVASVPGSGDPLHVTLTGAYSSCVMLTITPIDPARFYKLENVDSEGFDLTLYNASGTRVAADALWEFKGA